MLDLNWKGRKVLVTGADGFLGSHLSESLLHHGARVSVLVHGREGRAGTKPFKNIQRLKKDFRGVLTGDVSNPSVMSQIVKDAPQVIFHLAAQAYVPYSFDHPVEVMKINLQGTLHILEAARQIKSIERVVCTSSCEIYGTPLTARIREDHALNPMSPYAASKAAADRYASSYFSTYGLPITIARPFNAYGPRQTGNVVRRFIHFALKNEPITLHGDGSQSRDFTYVDDMVKAYLAIGARNKALGKAINLGSGREISMIQLARKIVRLCGSRSEIIHIPKRLADVPHFKADSSLAAKILGWEAETQLEEGLKKTLEWTGENLQAG